VIACALQFALIEPVVIIGPTSIEPSVSLFTNVLAVLEVVAALVRV
jgi:hypothetical protein